ncbi:DNA-binding protein [Nocardia cyriacigeorgica]|uniref:DNA-binding protein n=1 Tax=Nocardia cyriacigeorgica TaxID=135487 RepID=A0A5R8PGJ4_9NOCA|nr:DNA-binding protein [Nocardia cyriacigeorgica]TLG14007.1 DNA-binding protein [Nocardia cyriacigeorgica]
MPGTLLLDCEGLSKLYRRDKKVVILVEAARQEGIRVGTTTMTRLEAERSGVHKARIAWVLSRLDLHEITRSVSDSAAELLRDNDLSGHKYAIDATLAAVARSARPPVTLLTSDPEDLTLLCGRGVSIIKV